MAGPEIKVAPLTESAVGGAHEGSSKLSRELALWSPPMRSADGDLLGEKELLDARARDIHRNDGYASGAAHIHKDSIVGSAFKLNAKPDYKVLGSDETWATEFQEVVEAKFALYAESDNNWLDASGINTLTAMVRLAIGTYVSSAGEVVATAEWLREANRPYKTAIQLIDPDRLSNPNGIEDNRFFRRGVERNARGKPIAYHFRMAHPHDFNDLRAWKWKRVPATKPWGRRQVIHIFEQLRIDQSRGISDMVAVLKQMRMTKKFQDITLQNAVVNATFAAAIESDLPPSEAFASLGEGDINQWAATYLSGIAEYTGGSRNIHIDGVKIPHLYPGTKLSLLNAGTPGGVGTNYEESLLRHIAASLGLSYEQFSRDYTRTNYSSARASMGETWKFMQSRKKMVADRFASAVYTLWLEEAINAKDVPLPSSGANFYDGLNKEAYSRATWIGASRGQIDELKETQAAVLRVKAGFSTYEAEIAKLGSDFRDVFEQRAREEKIIKDRGLMFDLGAKAELGSSSEVETDKTGADEDKDKKATRDGDGDGAIDE